MLLGFFLVRRTEVHRLHGCAEKGVEERAGETCDRDHYKVDSGQCVDGGEQNGRQGDDGRACQRGERSKR